MIKIAVVVGAFAVVASPAHASHKHHHRHHRAKAIATGAAIGGVVGFAVANQPGAIAGAAAGAAIAAEITKDDHKGYKYWKGYYYDGKGHRFTAEELRRSATPALSHHISGYKYADGYYYDGAGHRFTAAEMRSHWSKKYPGYILWNGFYYRDGKRYSPEQMATTSNASASPNE